VAAGDAQANVIKHARKHTGKFWAGGLCWLERDTGLRTKLLPMVPRLWPCCAGARCCCCCCCCCCCRLSASGASAACATPLTLPCSSALVRQLLDGRRWLELAAAAAAADYLGASAARAICMYPPSQANGIWLGLIMHGKQCALGICASHAQ